MSFLRRLITIGYIGSMIPASKYIEDHSPVIIDETDVVKMMGKVTFWPVTCSYLYYNKGVQKENDRW